MVGGIVYLDASALVKLVVDEAESAAMLAYVRSRPLQATSVIAQVELARAFVRAGMAAPGRLERVMATITLVALDMAIVERASAVDPPTLRALDAIHLATAMSLGDELDAIVTYDARLADAARILGLEVAAPG